MMYRRALFVAALLAPVAARTQAAPISVQHVWSRAALAGHTGVGYLTISNSGAPDTLTGVSSPVAPQAELHKSYNENGVMKMQAVVSLPVVPGKPVTLAPGGYHIMLVGLKHALNAGETFPVTLHFAKAGDITVMAIVEKAGATGMEMPAGSTMPGKKM
jgi:periplasmic copper chaperone A